jgi:hypothetical protein
VELQLPRSAKLLAGMLAMAAFFALAIARMPFTTVSPDSIRFMHFAEINADRAVAEGGTVKTAITATLRSIKGMNSFDFNRGRLVQGVAYGVDAMTRWMLPFATLNLLMILILSANAGLAAILVTRGIQGPERWTTAVLAWIALLTTSLVLSPVMLLILYGKYLWITFVLAHFVAHKRGWKIFWLVPAAYSDEIGLIAVALIAFFYVARMRLFAEQNADRVGSWKSLLAAFLVGIAAALNVVLAFFGISAIVFNAGAGTFSGFAARGLKGAIGAAQTPWEMVQGVLWRAEVVVLGMSTNIAVITALIGAAALGVIVFAIVRQSRRATASDSASPNKVIEWFRAAVTDPELSSYGFWLVMLIVVAWLILPGRANDLTHYSYPAAILLSILLLKSLLDLVSVRKASTILSGIVLLHLILFPRIVDFTSGIVQGYLLGDHTVTAADIRKVNQSIEEIRKTGKSALFDSINNGQEIDFSGTWYYSRVRWFGIATEPHWPVQGTVRVLTWPKHVAFKCTRRNFLYTRAEFTDTPCPKN